MAVQDESCMRWMPMVSQDGTVQLRRVFQLCMSEILAELLLLPFGTRFHL